jgi:RHS repeat-associated protein
MRSEKVNVNVFYGYRWFDPVTGRWPSRDPLGEKLSMNLYVFIDNNVSAWFDVLGLFPSTANFDTGVYDMNTNDRGRMERPGDSKSSKERYERLSQIRKEAANVLEDFPDAAGTKGAILANSASQEGPRFGDAINMSFNIPVEYGGRVCCKNKKYKITGPSTTGGMSGLQRGGFDYVKPEDHNDLRYQPLPTDLRLWPAELRKLKESGIRDDIDKRLGRASIDPCPEGWDEAGGYHTHPKMDASPSLEDKRVAERLAEYISGNRGGMPGQDLRRINKDGSSTRLNPNGTPVE